MAKNIDDVKILRLLPLLIILLSACVESLTDDSQLHLTGYEPDFFVERSIEAVRNNRDEFLEKAIELILNNDD